MKRTILALAIAGLSVAAYASPPPGGGPPTPIDVNVTNPVLAVEKLPTNFAQFHVTCSNFVAGERSCYADLGSELNLAAGQRFVIQFANAYIQTSSSAPRRWQWGLGYGTYAAQFGASKTIEYNNQQYFVGGDSVLLIVDEVSVSGIPQFYCLSDIVNDGGAWFGCSFTVTGYFAPKP
jgi:hypothetical protein